MATKGNTGTENMNALTAGIVPQAHTDDLILEPLSDELLIYDLQRNTAHALGHTAALVWHHCDGQRTVADIARLVEAEACAPVPVDVVWMAVEQLSQAQLLDGPVVRPAGMRKISRRDLLRLGSTMAATAFVSSIFAGSPGMAASSHCSGLGGPCNQNDDCCPGLTCRKRTNGICSPI